MKAAVKRHVEAIMERAAAECYEAVRVEAQRVLDTSPRYGSFAAAMGTSCFYDRKGMSVFSEDLTNDARAVVDLSDEVTAAFGSPGVQLMKG